MQLYELNPFYYSAVLRELWHLNIILLLDILQRIPLDVEVIQLLQMNVSWRDVTPKLGILLCRFCSNRDALPGLRRHDVMIHSDDLVVHHFPGGF